MIKQRKSIVGLIIFTITLIINVAILDARNDKLMTQLNQNEVTLQQTQVELANAIENFERECELNSIIRAECVELESMLSDLKSTKYELVYVGDFKITYYCDSRYNHICGGNGITASGKSTDVGVTAAADWSILPNGSIVYIEGIGFREIQDVGGGVNGNHIDVLVETHDEAIDLGTHNEGVWLLIKTDS